MEPVVVDESDWVMEPVVVVGSDWVVEPGRTGAELVRDIISEIDPLLEVAVVKTLLKGTLRKLNTNGETLEPDEVVVVDTTELWPVVLRMEEIEKLLALETLG